MRVFIVTYMGSVVGTYSCAVDAQQTIRALKRVGCEGAIVCEIFVTLGQGITGGRTLYFNGTNFDKKDPTGTRGEQIHAVDFAHGQYQVGQFEEVVHFTFGRKSSQ